LPSPFLSSFSSPAKEEILCSLLGLEVFSMVGFCYPIFLNGTQAQSYYGQIVTNFEPDVVRHYWQNRRHVTLSVAHDVLLLWSLRSDINILCCTCTSNLTFLDGSVSEYYNYSTICYYKLPKYHGPSIF
jgi:hypothetical protein